MGEKSHWENVYRTRPSDAVGWYQRDAGASRERIRRFAPNDDAAVIDVGGGASVLVDELLAAGYQQLTVLDLSEAALAQARARLGARAADVVWRQGDVLDASLSEEAFDVWHDRAVFHFLTDPAERDRYARQLDHAVRLGGHVVIGTFATDAPAQCSGLPVQRHSPDTLQAAFGSHLQLVDAGREIHITPSGIEQPFNWCVFRKGHRDATML